MIKIFSFIKDEILFIEDWIKYHSSIIGIENIHIIDQGSTDGTLNILKKYKGINLHQIKDSFDKKSIILSNIMKQNKNCFLIPLDADEFLTLKNSNDLCTDKDKIISYINNLPVQAFRYKFNQIDVIPSKETISDPLVNLTSFKTKWYESWKHYAKTFYHSNFFVSTDQGNHKGSVNGHGKDMKTDLTIVHYDVTDYNHFVRKTTRGAIAYNHHTSKKPLHGKGTHYHRRYWAIKEGNGLSQMIKEFGNNGNFITHSISNKIKELR
jgi:hypothetical protein